jgi:cold shock CspA family protein
MASPLKRASARTLAVAVLIAALFVAMAVSQAEAALRHLDGTVLSKNSANHTFRIKKENGGRTRIHVNRATEFERIPGGFSGLHRGLRVEVDAKRTNRGLLAKQVEKDRHRGGGGGGADDGPTHS